MMTHSQRSAPMLHPTLDAAGQEAEIMASARDDISQFEPLYRHYYPRVYAYCLRRLGSEQEAEDLTSQVFVRALTHIDSYRGGHVTAWIFRIAHNLLVNHLRKRDRYTSLEDMPLEPVSDLPGPLEQLLRREEQQIVQQMMATLSQHQQELLALRIFGELKSHEISTVLGKKPGAIRTELHRIFQHLRTLYPKERREP